MDERVVHPTNSDTDRWTTVQTTFHRAASREQALIFFDLFHTSGKPLKPVLASDLKDRFSPKHLALFKRAFIPEQAYDVVQVQAFVMTEETLSVEDTASIRAEYEHFRGQVYSILMGERDSL